VSILAAGFGALVCGAGAAVRPLAVAAGSGLSVARCLNLARVA